MQSIKNPILQTLKSKLDIRDQNNALRTLKQHTNLIDFASNDYLGFAREKPTKTTNIKEIGSTGSRLLTGNYPLIETAEKNIANYHGASDGLIYNSGYTANIGLISCIATRHDYIIYDELCHASIYDGIQLSLAKSFKFAHSNLTDLKRKIAKASGTVFVIIEAVYSMDGDAAPLEEITQICEASNAALIIDEAHSGGVFGTHGEGLVSALNVSKKSILAQVFTFGKALGSHGAIVVGSATLRAYLINFSRSFIYTTAPSPNHILELEERYQQLQEFDFKKLKINELSNLLKSKLKEEISAQFIPSNSPINGLIIGGNDATKKLAKQLQKDGFDIRPILSPTVPKKKERLRICMHHFNTEQEIIQLANSLNQHFV